MNTCPTSFIVNSGGAWWCMSIIVSGRPLGIGDGWGGVSWKLLPESALWLLKILPKDSLKGVFFVTSVEMVNGQGVKVSDFLILTFRECDSLIWASLVVSNERVVFNGVDWLTGETPRFNNGSSGDMNGNEHRFVGGVVAIATFGVMKGCCDAPNEDDLLIDDDNILPISFDDDDDELEVSPVIKMLILSCRVLTEGSILTIIIKIW